MIPSKINRRANSRSTSITSITSSSLAVFLLCGCLLAHVDIAVAATVEVGQQVCIAGYVTDRFCIDLGTFLDAPELLTLKEPESHSYHCLLDVPRCIESGYEALLDPIVEGGMYVPAAKLDAAGNELFLKTARSYGSKELGCSTCTGENGTESKGFRATIMGKLQDLGGDGGSPPIVSVSSIEVDSVCPVDDASVMNIADIRKELGLIPPSPYGGEEVCITGYVVDRFCIDNGVFLDAPTVTTLKEPELHSYHCLLDVPKCVDSGYEALLDPTEGSDDMYIPAVRFNAAGNELFLETARAIGDPNAGCTTCTGTKGTKSNGFRATIMATIEELGTDGGPLTVGVSSIDVDSLAGCPIDGSVTNIADLADTFRLPTSEAEAVEAEDLEAGENAPPTNEAGFTEIQLTDELKFQFRLTSGETPSDRRERYLEVNAMDVILTYEGTGWLAWGINPAGTMTGTEAIIGKPDDGSVEKYTISERSIGGIVRVDDQFQTLTGTSLTQENGKTIMKFTKLLNEAGEHVIDGNGVNTFIYADGSSNTLSYHKQRGSFEANLAEGGKQEAAPVQKDYTTFFIVHGILMFIAWGLLTPMAVATAFVRSLFPGALWFKIHMFFNATSFILTLTSFIVALSTGLKFDNPHFITGWVIMCLVTVQVILGALRPHAVGGDQADGTLSIKESVNKQIKELNPPSIRSAWEVCHKFFGLGIVALALWQMHTGFVLLQTIYGQNNYVTAYWGWIIAFGVVVAVLKLYAIHQRNLAVKREAQQELKIQEVDDEAPQ